MNGILTQYLMRSILTVTALVLLVLLALVGLFEFIGELDDTQGEYQTAQVVLYTVLRLPQLAFEMLPIAALIGSLLALGALASNSEIIVMRAAGLSVTRLAGMVGVTGLAMLMVTGLLGEFIGPPLDYFARNMRLELRSDQADGRLGQDAWARDGNKFLHFERVSLDYDFGSIYLFRFDESNRLQSIARAENSGVDDAGNWILQNFHETRFVDDGVQVVESSRAIENFDIDPGVLGISLVKPQSLSGRGLLSYVAYLKRNSLDASRYETELWYRVARTVTVIVMPLLALAFVFGSLRTGGAGARLMIGVVIGLAYYLAAEMLANSGQVFNLNPALIAWLPSGLLVVVTLFALNRVR
ncbi:MAG: LPS export ABC transporter permease LptG [Gammaproteobacteria bacterium]|nr:LPS export ABC transporter permease LptG [Gammaproteobacteria bacterium]MDH5303852.1 LPS export ABC transporter permease LptG [Gammaproteobacteria bacterium]